MFRNHYYVIAISTFLVLSLADKFDEEQYGVKYADHCEICKIVSNEITLLLSESDGKHEVLETGYSVQKEKKKTKYAKSELRLIDTMESVCGRLLEYNIHKERKDWTRFARGKSETFQALDGLVAKGVKVDIGIPNELWHKPSAEITHLKNQCETMIEEHEEDIEDWFFNHKAENVDKEESSSSLENFLCRQGRMLKTKEDQKCLDEINKKTKKKKQRVKGETGERKMADTKHQEL